MSIHANKLRAGAPMPAVIAKSATGETANLADRSGDRWKMIIVYRGTHCPLCVNYLNKVPAYLSRLDAAGIDLAIVSSDSAAQLESFRAKLTSDAAKLPIFHSLSIQDAQTLGLYISHPRSETETDHPFPEPALFVVNADDVVQVIDIANNPFLRPELDGLLGGLEYIRSDKTYPIRGTFE